MNSNDQQNLNVHHSFKFEVGNGTNRILENLHMQLTVSRHTIMKDAFLIMFFQGNGIHINPENQAV